MKTCVILLLICVIGFPVNVLGQAPYLGDTLGITGACKLSGIYDMSYYPKRNKPAICLVGDDEIMRRLNAIAWLRQNELKKASGSIMLIINCEGELINVQWLKKGIHEELNYYIAEVFRKHNKWQPALMDNKPVDSFVIRKLRVKKGVVSWK